MFNTNAVTNFVSWLCDIIGLDNKLSIRTLFFVIVYSTLDAMVRGDDSIFRPDKRKQLSEDSKQPSGLPEEIKCPCTNWDRTMLFETKILYDKVSGANDIDKINRGLDKINEKYEKIFDPKKEKCTSKKAFEDPGVIAALIIIPIAAYVGGGFTLKKYILPGLMFIWSKLSGTPAAPAAPVRAPPAATGGGVRVT